MDNRGMALITTVLLMFCLFAITASFLSLVTNAAIFPLRQHENLTALALAEAGVEYAIWEIVEDGGDFDPASGWSGTNPKAFAIDDFQDTAGITYGDISILVYDPGTDDVAVVSEGAAFSKTGAPVTRQIDVSLRNRATFAHGILTSDNISLTGNGTVDSYDSRNGDYGGSNKAENGDIATNGTGDPAISLKGNAKVKGDAETGGGGTITKTGNAEITGQESHSCEEPISPVDVPDSLEGAFPQGDLTCSGNSSITLSEGSYKYGSVNLSGNSKLTITGDVELYVTGSIQNSGNSKIIIEDGASARIYFDGDLHISGNGVWNKNEKPSDLSFFGTDSASSIKLSGNSDLYGTFYAPSADIDVTGNGDIYGALVGKTLDVSGNGNIHYDEALLDDDALSLGYEPYSWHEK